jgi:hypothetical protein
MVTRNIIVMSFMCDIILVFMIKLTSSILIKSGLGYQGHFQTAVLLILLLYEVILFLFQTYMDIFQNIGQSNPVAIGISAVSISVLSLYNEVLKVSENNGL